MVILAIESSCDDTAAAVMVNGIIQSNVVATQKVHEQYGGVIPELASRAHQQNIIPVVDRSLKDAGISKNEISAVAFTRGPGLLGSLLVCSSFAKSFSLTLGTPLIGVDHLEAHVLAHFIDGNSPGFPFLCLLVSGGHTHIVKVDSPDKMEVIGKTLDDAAGEAFDKAAKMMGLPYPGGPHLDTLAQKGNPGRFAFPDSRVGDLDFSFSGLKTSILYFLRDEKEKNPDFIEQNLNDLCASIQHTIVSYLMRKLIKAIKQTQIKEVAISGGVSANSELRKVAANLAEKHGWNLHIPALQYCTDNAGMIAMAAHFKYLENRFDDQSVVPFARMK
ncbi:MAG: tRNA (adenosine(37)-N6)-threonylcarbamoyltransferase complex transferase subunit TsaD [Bacteroidetes bacterium]|nr:tRNA (adenosine(37)-N6)-threonylcarbamoyltransferase complex transferase subunit TsaD [Bacteroidota bacterium]